MTGLIEPWRLTCPVCAAPIPPVDQWASLFEVVAPRLAAHLILRHPEVAVALSFALDQPPAAWPQYDPQLAA